ncbi:helix-turn-helix transcriptional regulator [Streptomyces sp. NBC_01275]|uniref:response regulator transcription factor n=1 Tax=Streptomyces sp. NBC_01275 TaxID=2903807 RepID=UPI00225278ED|nr:helix-turn-helix transcriptional regulator [Streptomyces sp. NBC_01275]MCX4765929.1 helix-turn-helix transcriptional regulator [Streptomyces sp. NBC_01275]
MGEREREVAVGRGLSNAEVAAELFMSVATVKAHVSRVLARLGLDHRVQIALLAYDAALLEEGQGPAVDERPDTDERPGGGGH